MLTTGKSRWSIYRCSFSFSFTFSVGLKLPKTKSWSGERRQGTLSPQLCLKETNHTAELSGIARKAWGDLQIPAFKDLQLTSENPDAMGPAGQCGALKGPKNKLHSNTSFKNKKFGLPWWRSGWESACQCRGHGFEPWSGRIPHATEQLSPCATTAEPAL